MAKQYNRKDHYYSQAKESGKRSRAYYKIQELDKKYQIFSRQTSVLDLGAWPGGWMQYALERVGDRRPVVGIDLVELDSFLNENAHTVVGDVRDEEALREVVALAGERFHVLVSDMSPKLTGIKSADRGQAVHLAELALWAAEFCLKPGGTFVAKMFKSGEADSFYRSSLPRFDKLRRTELRSTRGSSNEFYIVGEGFRSTEPT